MASERVGRRIKINVKINDVLSNRHHAAWRLRRLLPEPFVQAIVTHHLPQTTVDDKLVWSPTSYGVFSTASVRKISATSPSFSEELVPFLNASPSSYSDWLINVSPRMILFRVWESFMRNLLLMLSQESLDHVLLHGYGLEIVWMRFHEFGLTLLRRRVLFIS